MSRDDRAAGRSRDQGFPDRPPSPGQAPQPPVREQSVPTPSGVPVLTSRPNWLPEKLFPFRSRFVDIEGVHAHYVDEGSGPTLLLLHGNPTWSFLYRHLIRFLAGQFRCVALDFPGFGLSTAPTDFDFRPISYVAVLQEFCRTLALHDVVLMVQDWGGPIGFAVATADPRRFRGFVIGNTWAWSGKGDPHHERFARLMGGKVVGFLNRHFNFFARIVMRTGTRRKRLSAEEMRAYLAPFSTGRSREPMRILPREIIGSSEFLAAIERDLAKLSSHRALIVWGDRDFAFREAERRRFESIFPDHRTVILPGAGHFIQEDAPAEIASAIQSEWCA